MRTVQTHDPEILRIDDDSFAMKVCGFVAILLAGTIWPIYLHIEMANGSGPGLWPLVLALCVSLCLGVLGLILMLCASQTIIDRRLGKVVGWTRLLHWQQKDVFALKDFACVVVVRHSGRYGPTWSIKLQAKPRSRAKDVDCGIVPAQREASEIAAKISTFSGIPLEQPLPLDQGTHWK